MGEHEQQTLEYLKEHRLGVVSTVDKSGAPHIASVFYVYDEDFTFYFFSREATQKFEDIIDNNKVAFVVSSEDPPATVQMTGVAEVVASGDQTSEIVARLAKRTEDFSKNNWLPIMQMEGKGVRVVKITPNWLRYGNFANIAVGNNEAVFHQILS